MMGDERADAHPSSAGVLPRIATDIFHRVRARTGRSVHDIVRAAFVEIYMERATDLLVPDVDPAVRLAQLQQLHPGWSYNRLADEASRTRELQIRGGSDKMLHIGAVEVPVLTVEDVQAVVEIGMRRRQTAETGSNAVSSRSHAIFILTLTSHDSDSLMTKTSQLYCCDLAGSEKIDKTVR
jgi:hypothetical protein